MDNNVPVANNNLLPPSHSPPHPPHHYRRSLVANTIYHLGPNPFHQENLIELIDLSVRHDSDIYIYIYI